MSAPKQQHLKKDLPLVVAASSVVTGKGSGFLDNTRGVLYRQDHQYAEAIAQECCGLPCEKKNRFKIAPMPVNKRAIRSHGDEAGWSPSQAEIDGAPYAAVGQEESDCCFNIILYSFRCLNLRPFTMKWMAGSYELLEVKRPFTCGGICCSPHNVEVRKDGYVIGKVVEDWNCGNWLCRISKAACCCTIPYTMQVVQNGKFVNRYNIDFNWACCGNHNNFCGATPCCRNQLWDVKEYNSAGLNKDAIGRIQKTYGDSCSLSAYLRCCCADADNYIVEWPENATAEERALFIASTTLLTYIFYEKKDFNFVTVGLRYEKHKYQFIFEQQQQTFFKVKKIIATKNASELKIYDIH